MSASPKPRAQRGSGISPCLSESVRTFYVAPTCITIRRSISRTVKPTVGALNDPTLGQHVKPLCCVGALDFFVRMPRPRESTRTGVHNHERFSRLKKIPDGLSVVLPIEAVAGSPAEYSSKYPSRVPN